MKKIRSFIRRFQLQYRRTSALNKVAIAAAIVLSSVTLLSLRVAMWEAEETLSELRHQSAVMEQENEQLREDISQLGTLESIQKIAREVLDLVMPGTVFFNTGD